jgi:type I restriction enzyme R subunit
LKDEDKFITTYKELKAHKLFKTHFSAFESYNTNNPDISIIIALDEAFDSYIKTFKEDAKKLKEFILNYFRILNLLEFVVELDKKYSEKNFVEFWRKFNMIYNQINKQTDIIDDVEIYFDNRIGIVAPIEPKPKGDKPKNPNPTSADQPNKYKYNILKVIEKRNQEEEAIAELIADFEKKIEDFFNFIKADDFGKRLVAKIKDDGTAFSDEEVYSDFTRIYRKYTIKNKELGEFFLRETKDILHQLCDDFERELKESYIIFDPTRIAAEKQE